MRTAARVRSSLLLAGGASLFLFGAACGEAEPTGDSAIPGVPVELLAGKADGADSIVDQRSADVTVVKAEALDPIGGYGAAGFGENECTPIDGLSMDCTARFEERFGAPALHPITVGRGRSDFFCRVLRVQTVSKADAVGNSDGIGFYYRGYSSQRGFRFVERSRLVSKGEATLASGEKGVRHEFLGLANCWLGSASSSSQATYEFKPFMRFTAPDSGVQYRNWDEADNYKISPRSDRFDRSGELLE